MQSQNKKAITPLIVTDLRSLVALLGSGAWIWIFTFPKPGQCYLMSQSGWLMSIQTALPTSVRNQCCSSSHLHSADPGGTPWAEALPLLTAASVPWSSSTRPPTASSILKSNDPSQEHLPAPPGPCQFLTQNWHQDIFFKVVRKRWDILLYVTASGGKGSHI